MHLSTLQSEQELCEWSYFSSLSLCHVKVKSDYEQLRETLANVSEQRDTARREKDELQVKLENLEQALKVRRNIYYFISYNKSC